MILNLVNKINSFIYKLRLKEFLKGCKKKGKNIIIEKNFDISGISNITLGNNIYIGPNVLMMAVNAEIIIGDFVMFGPNVSLITGDHRTDVLGEFMYNVIDKKPENDQNIIIENDVWIGANATILKGITIGEGSIIGANALVTKNVPSYSIVIGTNDVYRRFSEEEIKIHKNILKKKYKS